MRRITAETATAAEAYFTRRLVTPIRGSVNVHLIAAVALAFALVSPAVTRADVCAGDISPELSRQVIEPPWVLRRLDYASAAPLADSLWLRS